jgi:hypothetical protein
MLMTYGMRVVLAGVALSATFSISACGADAICGGKDYPVTTVGATGRACVTAGHEPPAGYVRFPAGKVPEHVGDKWDTYWETHMIDRTGAIAPA